MKKILLVFFFALASLTLYEVTLPHYASWHRERIAHLNSQSHIIQTSVGPIEYGLEGSGPVVLSLHGGFGGFDQGLLIAAPLVSQGFTVLAPSRPGYLRTPLSVGETIAEQADAMAALLDALKIQQVVVLGLSAGAPIASEFALRYPEKTKGVVLESLGVHPSHHLSYVILNNFLFLEGFINYASWLFYKAMINYPHFTEKLLLSLDNSLCHSERDSRKKYVLSHPLQFEFLKKLAFSATPMGPKRLGLINDIKNLDAWPTFPYLSMTTPALIIEAQADSTGSYSEARNVSDQLPHSQLITVEESGHFIWFGAHTQQWENELIDFLKRHHP